MNEPSSADVVLLSRKSLGICFAISLAVFFLGGESLLENPFRIDSAIISSYLIIPVLVLFAHLLEKNRNLTSFIIANIELTCLKFAATYLIATGLWIYAGEPPQRESKQTTSIRRTRSYRAPTKIPASNTSTLQGQVLNDDGQPILGALVYIEHGLEDIVFKPNTATVSIMHTGEQFEPWLTVLQTNQALIATSQDLRLHTLLDSYPVLPKSSSARNSGRHDVIRILRPITTPKPISCGVHPQHTTTSTSYIAVFDHPFAQQLKANGQFRFDSVPSRNVTLAAWHPKWGTQRTELMLKPGQTLVKNLILKASE